MKRLTLALCLSLVTAAALATPAAGPRRQSPPAQVPPAATPEGGAAQTVDQIAGEILGQFDATSRSDASIAKANTLIAEIAKAYREVPTLTDTMTLTVRSLDNVSTETFAVALGKGTDARLAMPGVTMLALDGQVTVVADEPSDRALRVPMKGDLMATLAALLPNFGTPVTILDLRAGRPVTTEGLGLLALRSPRIAGLKEVGGTSTLLVMGENGASMVSVDSGSKLFTASRVLFAPPDAPAGFVMEVTVSHQSVVADAVSAPLSVHLGDRRIVTSIEEYMPTMPVIAPGQVVPAWTMRSIDGTTVSLADLKGSVVVLDFWASYCAPCKRAMPYIDEFAKWAAQSGKPIRVFAVNTLESGDAAARVAEASGWWHSQRFSFPCLMDIDDGVSESMGIRVLPTTLIIGPDGVLSAMHRSFDPAHPGQTVEALKEAVEKALAPKS